MKVAWNKVTWYSKLIAFAIFIVFPFVGFYFGIQVGVALQIVHDTVLYGTGQSAPVGSDYYSTTADWQTDSNNTDFTIAYPIDFSTQDNYAAVPSADWRLNANGSPGITYFTLGIPSAFDPQTNFADATLTVGASRSSQAIARCLTPDASGGSATAPPAAASIHGIAFSVFSSTGVGAGNYYQTTSYRTVHAGACWAVEYTIHSSQIANYPASYRLQPFDEGMVAGVLNRIVGTFHFK